MMTERKGLRWVIRRKDLPKYVGLQRTQIDRLIKLGEFPKPFPLSDSGHAVAWLEDEIAAWQESRIKARVNGGGNDKEEK